MSSIFVLAGEASGDLLGGQLISSLKKESPSLKIWGVGGAKMRQEEFECLMPMEEFQVMGFREILFRPFSIISQFRTLRNQILERHPDIVVLIDYPGFNLRLAKSLRKKGFQGKIVQYVSPSVWVWGKGRIQTLANNHDLLLTILPFVPPLYSHTSLRTEYVGCPVIEDIQKYEQSPTPLTIHPHKKILGIFPGSRRAEIENNFALQLEVAKAIVRDVPNFHVAVSCSQPQYRKLIDEYVNKAQLGDNLTVVEGNETYPLMEACDIALAKSGTVTLELAMFRKPTAVVYQVDRFNRFVAKHVLRLNLTHVALTNLLAKRFIQPEFILEPFTKEELIGAVKGLAVDEGVRKKCLEGYEEVADMLGKKKASAEAAKAILSLIG
ncbi:MAG: Lipid-A-disaccharide synthase [Chlamydiae bacterium]|nr:Lipid-A-disaccharide synthase [Chlamydiota bacterium]